MRTAADLDGAAVVNHLAADALVLRVEAATEDRQVQSLNASGVANVPIENGAGGAKMLGTSRHQFAEQGIVQRRAGRDVDLTGFEVVKRLEHQPERFLRERTRRCVTALIEDVGLKHRHSAAGDHHVGF